MEEKEIKKENELTLFKDIASKLKNIKINLTIRKKLAKELSIEEKKALNWQTLEDVFSCLDTSTLAEEHPEEAAKVFRVIAKVVGTVFPITNIVTSKTQVVSDDIIAKIVKYCGMPTPEHVAHVLIAKENKKAQKALENINIDVEEKEETK